NSVVTAAQARSHHHFYLFPPWCRKPIELGQHFHDFGGVEIDDEGSSGFQTGAIESDCAIDVLCRPSNEHAARCSAKEIDETGFQVTLGDARLIRTEIGTFHQEDIDVCRWRLH